MKRKRHRQKKKHQIQLKKYGTELCTSPGNDSGYTSTPAVAEKEGGDKQFQETNLSMNNHEETLSTDDSDSLPADWEGKALMQEAEQIRQRLADKEADLMRKYGDYVDSEPAFVFRNKKPYIPTTVGGIDRKVVEVEMNKLLCNERKALEQAMIYRDKCTTLKEKCRQLETEKEGVRFFWRNKLMEGQTHAAKMLKAAITIK